MAPADATTSTATIDIWPWLASTAVVPIAAVPIAGTPAQPTSAQANRRA